MREDGRGQSKGLLCALLFLEALFEEETSFPSLNSFVYKCVGGPPSVRLFTSSWRLYYECGEERFACSN